MEFHQQLAKQHYARLPFNISKAELGEAARAFLDFPTLPTDVLRSLHFPSPYENGTADGYTDKRDSGRHDKKQLFHWSPLLEKQPAYQEVRRRYQVARTFFEHAAKIYDAGDEVSAKLLRRHFTSNIVEQTVMKGRLASAVLRFLAYDPQAQDFSARAHYDKCPGTLALAESSPGLRIGCCDQHPLKKVEYRDGTCVFMPGQLLFEDTNGTIIPAWHDVVHHADVPPVREDCARWSIVFFINEKNGRFPSYEATHTPVH